MRLKARILSIGVLILVISNLTGCFKLQRAAGCNNVGILGCKDKPETSPQGPEAFPELNRASDWR